MKGKRIGHSSWKPQRGKGGADPDRKGGPRYNFIRHEPGQQFIMPPSLDDWLPEDHVARWISSTVDSLEKGGRLQPFYDYYRDDGTGHPAYHPCMLLKIILYAYCLCITSSRKIERLILNDVGARFLSGNLCPDHRTISDFRKNHIDALKPLFTSVLGLCKKAGLASVGRVSLDGTKMKANASLMANRKRAGLEKIAKDLLDEADRVDREEDERYGSDRSGDELPQHLSGKENRENAIAEAYRRLHEEEQPESNTDSSSDGHRRHGLSGLTRGQKDRLRRVVEAHHVVEEKEQNRIEEQERLLEERAEEEARTGKKKRGRKPKDPSEKKIPDAQGNTTDPESRIMKTQLGWVQGYNAQAVVDCESGIIVGQAVTQDENDKQQLSPMLECVNTQFGRYPEQVLADAGYWSESNAEREAQGMEFFIPSQKDYKARKAMLERPSPRGRIPKRLSKKDRIERRMRTKAGRKIYSKRSSTIEPTFGQMKENRRHDRFRIRGLRGAQGEWSLMCTVHNLLKLFKVRDRYRRDSVSSLGCSV